MSLFVHDGTHRVKWSMGTDSSVSPACKLAQAVMFRAFEDLGRKTVRGGQERLRGAGENAAAFLTSDDLDYRRLRHFWVELAGLDEEAVRLQAIAKLRGIHATSKEAESVPPDVQSV